LETLRPLLRAAEDERTQWQVRTEQVETKAIEDGLLHSRHMSKVRADLAIMKRERDELRTENSRLAEKWITEQEAHLAAEAEAERLRRDLAKWQLDFEKCAIDEQQLWQENKRLRAALEEIRATPWGHTGVWDLVDRALGRANCG
jgi:hypothetical protein